MKAINTFLILTFFLSLTGAMAQRETVVPGTSVSNEKSTLLDESFTVSHDTLYFLDPQAFSDGRSFYIRNPHDYAIEIQSIDQSGAPYPHGVYLFWYTIPYYTTFPVAIPAHDSVLEEVRWVVTKALPQNMTIVYDSLLITTLTDSINVIIAADSIYITPTSVNKLSSGDLSVSPNPFTTQVRICWNIVMGEPSNVKVFNALMQPVRTIWSGRGSGQKQEFNWDGMNENRQRVSPGVYFIRLQTPSGQRTLRVVSL